MNNSDSFTNMMSSGDKEDSSDRGVPLFGNDHNFVNVKSHTSKEGFPSSPTSSEAVDVEGFLAHQGKLHDENDSAIVAELNRLSLQERERVLHDIHGVSGAIEENPELLKQSLQQLESCLIPEKTSKAYQLAYAQNPAYVEDEKFRLMFLRSEEFNVPAAAKKLQRLLAIKLDLFGEDKLCRPITLDDLGDDDIECMKNGHIQGLTRRDQSGRAIIVLACSHIQYKTLENELRQMFYFFMAEVEDEGTQTNGVVIVSVGLPNDNPWNAWRVNGLMTALPFAIRGWHVTHASWGGWLNWLSAILDKRVRMRIRAHSGTQSEMMHSLMTFGIPASTDFPVQMDDDGKQVLCRVNHLKWIEARRECERKRASAAMLTDGAKYRRANSTQMAMDESDQDEYSDSIFLPTSADVLFGRGRPFQEHPGNVRFSLVLESLHTRYDTLRRNEKTVLAHDVVLNMKSKGTRFLRQSRNGGYWEQVEDSVAREKVSQGFRSIRNGKYVSVTTSKTVEGGLDSKETGTKKKNKAPVPMKNVDDRTRGQQQETNKKRLRQG